MSKTYAVLDVNNLSHRNWYAMANTQYQNRVHYGLFRDILTLSQTLETTDFLFCFDQGESIRKTIHPEYKSRRDHDSDTYKTIASQIESLKILLYKVGFRNTYAIEGYEADDLMGFLCEKKTDHLTFVSNDKDLYQLLWAQTFDIWNPSTKRYVTAESFGYKYKIMPAAWAEVKALSGCITDDIPGVVGDCSALKYLQGKLPSTSRYFERITSEEGVRIYTKNQQLVTLPCPLLKDPRLTIKQDCVTAESWQELMVELGFSYLADRSPFPSKHHAKG
jgi:5'-3' exonuclease